MHANDETIAVWRGLATARCREAANVLHSCKHPKNACMHPRLHRCDLRLKSERSGKRSILRVRPVELGVKRGVAEERAVGLELFFIGRSLDGSRVVGFANVTLEKAREGACVATGADALGKHPRRIIWDYLASIDARREAHRVLGEVEQYLRWPTFIRFEDGLSVVYVDARLRPKKADRSCMHVIIAADVAVGGAAKRAAHVQEHLSPIGTCGHAR
jgi:hypothetical protein